MKQIWNHNTICIGYRPIRRYPFLVGRGSITEDIRISNCILLSAAAIRSIPFDGIYIAILDLLHDSGMVGYTISVPVEENDHSRFRCDAPVCPLVSGFEPLHTGTASSKLWDDCIQITTFVGAPADETGTPFHMLREAVPSPIGFSSHIANLRSGNLYNQLGVIRVIENLPQRVVAQHMENPGSVPAKQDRSLATRCRR